MEKGNKFSFKNINLSVTIVPLVFVIVTFCLLIKFPEASSLAIDMLRHLLVNRLGILYMIFGLVILALSIWLAFSKYGNIKLGKGDKPRYGNFSWAAMLFTATMGCDLIFWSLTEWIYYASDTPFGMTLDTLGQQDWASTYTLFHWGPIPWAFYVLPSAAYAYLMHVRGRNRQTLSEACRPILGKHADGKLGTIINIVGICCTMLAVASHFAFIAPVLSRSVNYVFGIPDSAWLAIAMLVLTAAIYTMSVLNGLRGINFISKVCTYLFFALLAIFLFSGDTVYILESGLTGIGNMLQNFLSMSTWMDPLRMSGTDGVAGFTQNWTVFYWAFWIAFFVATPFFIARISEGRTIRNLIAGCYGYGLAGTYMSFIIFGNYALGKQMDGSLDSIGALAEGMTQADVIMMIFETLPFTELCIILLVVCMMFFSATTFDSLTLIISEFSIKRLGEGEGAPKPLKVFWCLALIVLPSAMLFNDSSFSNLQTLCIIGAFPLAIIMSMVVVSFFKLLRRDFPVKNKVVELPEELLESRDLEYADGYDGPTGSVEVLEPPVRAAETKH